MPARSRTRKWSIDRRAKQSIIGQMLYNQCFRPRRILLILVIVIVYFSFNLPISKPNQTSNQSKISRPKVQLKINKKIVEISDRPPSFKLYVYEGYNIASERNRAQNKLLDNIKLYDRCQQNSKLIVIDVGASLGQFGLYAAACGCQVYMFEVNPLKIELLKQSIKLNSFESRVTLIEKAVTDLNTVNQISMSFNRSSQIHQNEILDPSDTYTVDATSLNHYNFSADIYLLRVDVEGFEIHVIRSSEKLFRQNLVHHVLVQYTPTGTDRVIQNDLLAYMRDILGGKRFFALHPKEAAIFGPLYNEDIDQFYTQHQAQNLERDVYVLFQDEDLNIDAKTYEFASSFDSF